MKGAPAGVFGGMFTGAELMNGSPLVAEKSTIVLWLKPIGEHVPTGAPAVAA